MNSLNNKITTLLTAVLLIFSEQAFSQSLPVGVRNVILVHGAFADGSSWSKVVPILQKKGYNVIAVQNPLISLESDVAATQRAISQMDGQVLLVGHSWAGMVISEAGKDPKVSGLLYVSALVPDEGQAVADVVKAFPQAPGNAEFQIDSSGYLFLSYKGFDEFFAQDVPSKMRKALFASQGPWAAFSTTQPVADPAWKYKPSWCLISSQDQIINPDLERAEAKMIGAKTLEINASHASMVSKPKQVAKFIIEAAEQLK